MIYPVQDIFQQEEDFISSALRELKEELGYDAKPEQLIYCGQRQFEFQQTFHGKLFHDNQVSNVI